MIKALTTFVSRMQQAGLRTLVSAIPAAFGDPFFSGSAGLTSDELLGIRVRPVITNSSKNSGFMIFEPVCGIWGRSVLPRGFNVQRVVVHHTAPINTLDMSRRFPTRGEQTFTMQIRAVPIPFGLFGSRLQHLGSRLGAHPAYARFLDSVYGWSFPATDAASFARDLLIWGPRSAFVPRVEGGQSAQLRGRIVGYSNGGSSLAPIVKASLFRRPIGVQMPHVPADVDDVLDAVSWSQRAVLIEPNLAVAYFMGMPSWDPTAIASLLQTPVDIFLTLQASQGSDELYCSCCIVRAHVPLQSAVDAEFEVEEILPAILADLNQNGDFRLLELSELREAFLATIPGAPPSFTLSRNPVLVPTEAATALVAETQPVEAHADVFLGRVSSGKALFANMRFAPNTAIVGPSGSGKSTLASYFALQQTSQIVHIASTESVKDSPAGWIAKMGGTLKTLTLPDADSPKGELALMRVDVAEAEKFGRDLAAGVIKFPLAIRPEGGMTVRYFLWLESMLGSFATARATPKADTSRVILIFDDTGAYVSAASPERLGDLPVLVGTRLRSRVAWFVNQGRRSNVSTTVVVHSEKELEGSAWPLGLSEAFGLKIFMHSHEENSRDPVGVIAGVGGSAGGDHRITVTRPDPESKTNVVLAPSVDVGFGASLLDFLTG